MRAVAAAACIFAREGAKGSVRTAKHEKTAWAQLPPSSGVLAAAYLGLIRAGVLFNAACEGSGCRGGGRMCVG
jgi:hypothetical protein